MKSPFRKYLWALRQIPFTIIQHPEQFVRRPGRDFTRRRALYLERVMWLTISLLKKSLSVELDRFFLQLDQLLVPVTKSALVQARSKLKPEAFIQFFRFSAAYFYQFYKPIRWKKFRLWATDGSGFRLPDERELGDGLGWHGNQHNQVPSTRMLVKFDLLNNIICDVELHPRDNSELVTALVGIQKIPGDVLMVYDRGFGAAIIPFLHRLYGSHCLIRMSTVKSNIVKAFVSSGLSQQIITEALQPKALKHLCKLGIETEETPMVTYRLIRVELCTGEIEVLLTTLVDTHKYEHTHFAALYHKRWGIESCFFVLKSYFQLANFSAYTLDRCLQDIYCHFILYNIQTALHTSMENVIATKCQTRQHTYKPNRNVSLGLLNRILINLGLGPPELISTVLNRFQAQLLQTLEPVRPGKTKERRRRWIRGTERHTHEQNYRRAV